MRVSKLYSVLLSVLIAFGVWLYVVSTVSQEDDQTFTGIPVVMEGESVLTERNLMITSVSTNTVTLHLSGTRSNLNKVNSSNITVKVSLSEIYEPGERIALSYSISYPGDVPSNAFVEESRSPSYIYVNVDYRRTKEIPVTVKWTGTRSEDYLYDTENAVLDNSTVTIVGPAAVADLIEYALVEVDLTDQVESLSESLRYTLCDADGEPVDAEQITTSVEEVRVELQIQRIKTLQLTAELAYGGGATESNTTVTMDPEVIRVSGSEAVLAEIGETYSVGTINLAELERTSNELQYTISLPDGVTNQTGVTEVTVTVQFAGLKTKDFTIDNIQSINVPEGLEVEIISAKLTVKVRGPAEEIENLTEDDIIAVVDFSSAEIGTATYRATISFSEGFANVGAMKSSFVSATVQAAEE